MEVVASRMIVSFAGQPFNPSLLFALVCDDDSSTSIQVMVASPGMVLQLCLRYHATARFFSRTGGVRTLPHTQVSKCWHVLVGGLAIVAFSVGCYLGYETSTCAAEKIVNHRLLRRWFYVCVGLTLFGYLVWLGVGLKNGVSPALFMDVLLSDDATVVESIREVYFPTIPGVTTCTQFGLPAILLGLWLYFFDDRRVIRWMILIAILGVLRAILNSERLALIELVVPTAILLVRVVVLPTKDYLWMRRAGIVAPIVAPLLLAVVFGSFEYVRSWHHYVDDFDSYPQFVVWRLSGYYTTAHNNAAMAIETGHYPPIHRISRLNRFGNCPVLSPLRLAIRS